MKEVSRAIIIDDEGRVMLGKRARGTAAGLYGLIGGKPDQDESPQEAIIREVKEETGLDFEPFPYLEMLDSSSDPNEPWMVYYFVGTVSGELELEPNEVAAIVYLSENELGTVQIAFDHRERLIEYFQSLK